jgi:TPR repeat
VRAVSALCDQLPAQSTDSSVEKAPSEGRARELAQQIEAYKQALRIRPDDVDAHYYLAGKLLKQIAKVYSSSHSKMI